MSACCYSLDNGIDIASPLYLLHTTYSLHPTTLYYGCFYYAQVLTVHASLLAERICASAVVFFLFSRACSSAVSDALAQAAFVCFHRSIRTLVPANLAKTIITIIAKTIIAKTIIAINKQS